MIPFLDLKAINKKHRKSLIDAATRVIDSGWYILGQEVKAFEKEFAAYCNTKHCIGVANGLAYTSIGGDMLHIESVKVPGTGKITLTGKLGSVMEESAKIAYSCFKSEHLNLEYGKFNLHIHVPSGATPILFCSFFIVCKYFLSPK